MAGAGGGTWKMVLLLPLCASVAPPQQPDVLQALQEVPQASNTAAPAPPHISGLVGDTTLVGKKAEDEAMLTSLWSTVVISVLCLGFYLLARQSLLLSRHVYAPYSPEASRGAAAFPGVWGWVAELRDNGKAVRAGEVGLESEMLLRYVRHNLRLLCYAMALACSLVPAYASLPAATSAARYSGGNSSSGTACTEGGSAGGACLGFGSVLQTLTISHVPPASWRLLVPGLAALVFSLVYVSEQTCVAPASCVLLLHSPSLPVFYPILLCALSLSLCLFLPSSVYLLLATHAQARVACLRVTAP
jgi:hypothetical protein